MSAPLGTRIDSASFSDEAVARFHSRYTVGAPDECWLWVGNTNNGGYGGIRMNGRDYNASRIALALKVGVLPADMQACHHCDNPRCVNPAHLFAASQSANLRDMVRKGRSRTAFHRGVCSHVSLEEKPCAVCRRKRIKEKEARLQARFAEFGLAAFPNVKHGGRYAFMVGCRCEACVVANRQRRAVRQRRRRLRRALQGRAA